MSVPRQGRHHVDIATHPYRVNVSLPQSTRVGWMNGTAKRPMPNHDAARLPRLGVCLGLGCFRSPWAALDCPTSCKVAEGWMISKHLRCARLASGTSSPKRAGCEQLRPLQALRSAAIESTTDDHGTVPSRRSMIIQRERGLVYCVEGMISDPLSLPVSCFFSHPCQVRCGCRRRTLAGQVVGVDMGVGGGFRYRGLSTDKVRR